MRDACDTTSTGGMYCSHVTVLQLTVLVRDSGQDSVRAGVPGQGPPAFMYALARIARGQMDWIFIAFSSHRELKSSTTWTRLVPIFEFVPELKGSVCPHRYPTKDPLRGQGSRAVAMGSTNYLK